MPHRPFLMYKLLLTALGFLPVISFTAQKGMKGLGFLEETLHLIAPWVDTTVYPMEREADGCRWHSWTGMVGMRMAKHKGHSPIKAKPFAAATSLIWRR